MSSVATPAAVAGRYRPAHVRALFDTLAATYGWAGWLSAGLLGYWRRQLAQALPRPASQEEVFVVDLMAGGAELWPVLRRQLGAGLRGAAVDFSAPMLARAAPYAASPTAQLTLYQANALATPLPAGQADAVTCAFGLKTLLPADYLALATEAARLLRPGGQVALVEFVLPDQGWWRPLVLTYLAVALLLCRWLHPAAARHAELPHYASGPVELAALRRALAQAGFGRVRQRRLWPGCAVLVTGQKMS